ncbi:MAG: DUF2339 domain-containing protein [Lentisphaerae bacterium]|nr:DUF2339 domain-containing protein [Lentisphaerota bacterium]
MGDEAFWVLMAICLVLGLVGAPIAALILLVGIRKRQHVMAGTLADLKREMRRNAAAPAAAPAVQPPIAVPPPAPPVVPKPKPVIDVPPPRPPVVPPPRQPNPLEEAARQALRSIWGWIIVSEEHRRPGMSAEQAVATNWLIRIGVPVMVAGIGFFLKYSSDAGWLNPQAKISMTLLLGAGFLAAGIQLLGKRYDLIAQGLLGAGLASLYGAIFAAATLYHLIGLLPAFGLMICVTVGAGVMSVRFNSMLVAILGIIGGYATPIMLSTGSGNLVALYSYMVLLGIGVLGIAQQRGWHLLNAMAFAATWGLVSLSLDRYYESGLFWPVMPFLAAFFVLFSTITFIHQLVKGKQATVLELIMLVLNAGIFFGMSCDLIRGAYGRHWTAAVSLALAAFYTGHLYLFMSRKRRDRGLALGFIALAALFLIITIPLLLSDQWLTLCWSAQALVLLWLAAKLDSRFLRYIAYVLYMIVLGRFFTVDLYGQFGHRLPTDTTMTAYLKLLGQRLLGFGFPVVSMALAMRLHTKPTASASLVLEEGNDIRELVPPRPRLVALAALVFMMLFIYLHFELNRTAMFLCAPVRLPMLTMLWLGACLLLLTLYARSATKAVFTLLMLFVVGTLFKVAFIDLPFWRISLERYSFQATNYSFLEAGMRLLDFGVILAFFVYASKLLGRSLLSWRPDRFFGYGSLVLFLFYMTFELNTLLAHFVPGLRSGGISVFWGGFALSLITGGIIKGVRPLRFAGLALFLVATVKVILVDLGSLDPLYRIIAFILLGIVLLAGAFVYIKFENRLSGAESEKK